MKISVIIPVFNRPHKIIRAITSVLEQTYPPAEIIVVDDGSTDKTPKVFQRYGNAVRVIRQENKGVSAARNTGIRESSGDWIALLDSDDEWLPHKLLHQRKYHEQNKELNIFQCQEIWMRNGSKVNPRSKHKKYGGWIFKESLPLCIVSPSAVIFKRSLLEEVGGFDETFPVCEDYDLWLRITRFYPIGLDDKPGILKYGGHSDQLSKSRRAIDRYRIKAIQKHLSDPSFNGPMRLAALTEIIRKLKILIGGGQKRGNDVSQWQDDLKKYRAEKTRLKNAVL